MHSDAPQKDLLGKLHQAADEARPPREKGGWKSASAMVGFCAIMFCLMFFEFGGALNSYFTSDDLNHVTYAYRMLTDHGELLFRTFSTVWMQDKSVEIFYRPLIEVSFAVDQFFSGANPFGYHVSNFLYSFVGALAVLSIARSLAERFNVPGVKYIGYVAALFFAVSPLHTEVTTWLIGRVDGLSTMFYLLSFALFLKLPQRTNAIKHMLGWLSLTAFALALLCKEMSASLPFVLFACSFFLRKEPTNLKKLQQALLESGPYLALLAVYFLVRFWATGAFLGGYVGAVGEANVLSFSKLWYRVVHFWKLAFPFNEEVIKRAGGFENAFRAFYIVFGIYLLARIRFDRFTVNHLRLTGFLFCWLVLQLLPLYQVFMIHNSLAGSRLFYLSTAVLSIIAAVVLVPGSQSSMSLPYRKVIPALAAILFVYLTGLFVVVGRLNNECWIVAAHHVEEMQTQINSALATLPEKKKLLLAYAPIQVLGAHMFNRYYLIQSMLAPPLLKPDQSHRVCVLEPRFYTYDHLVPSGPLRRKLADSDNFETMYWDTNTLQLTSLSAVSGIDATGSASEALPDLVVQPGKLRGMTDIIAKRYFETRAVKFVDVDLENTSPSKTSTKDVLVLAFDESRTPPQGMDNWCQAEYDRSLRMQTVRFPVDEKFVWYLSKETREFRIYLGEKENLKIVAARLNDGKTLIPSLEPSGLTLRDCNDGARRPIKFPLEFKYDVSNVPGAVNCQIELSRPRLMFQLENFTYRDVRPSKKALRTWSEPGTTGTFFLDRNAFPEDASYQLRVFAQRADGSVCGVSSDLIDLGISDRPKGQEL